MLTFDKIYNVYKQTGIHFHLFESLNDSNILVQQSARNAVAKLNLRTENDVLLYVAYNI